METNQAFGTRPNPRIPEIHEWLAMCEVDTSVERGMEILDLEFEFYNLDLHAPTAVRDLGRVKQYGLL